MEAFSKRRMSDRTGAFVRAGTSKSQIRAAYSHLLIQAGGLLAFVRTPQLCVHRGTKCVQNS